MGRLCDWYPRSLYRMEQGSHVIFYRKTAERILIVRILHKSMEPERQVFENR